MLTLLNAYCNLVFFFHKLKWNSWYLFLIMWHEWNSVLLYVPYVGSTVLFRTLYSPCLNLGKLILYCRFPSFVAACTREVFSLKWRAATINLKYIVMRIGLTNILKKKISNKRRILNFIKKVMFLFCVWVAWNKFQMTTHQRNAIRKLIS